MRRQFVVWKKTTREPVSEVEATRRMMEQLLLGSKLPTKLTVDLDLGKLSATTKNRVINALQDGVLFSSSGQASQVYELMARKHNLPFAKVRKQAKFNEEGCWRLFIRGAKDLDNSAIQELMVADRVASRLAGSPYAKYYVGIDFNEGQFAQQMLFGLKEEDRIREAFRKRLTPEIQERASKAVEEVKQGITVRFTY